MTTVINAQTESSLKSSKCVQRKPIYEFFKRLFDIVFSFVAIILLSPLILIISIAVKTTSEGPVIFAHKRIGKGGKPISIYKFRSMVVNAEELIKKFTPEQKAEFEKNFKLDNDPRITKIGGFLRKTSLDELPQLFNIFKGDISIIGPRPVTERETQMYGNYRDMFLSVRPGLTGYWAASGRSTISYKRRMAMEIYYIKNRSFALDIKIFFKTIISVFKGEGAK